MHVLRREPKVLTLLICLAVSLCSTACQAQHPVDVQRKAAAGDYMAALSLYDKIPKRTSNAATAIAAAKSAWALSLPQRALDEYDRALHLGGLEPAEEARIHLAKGIIEYQEQRYQLALMQVEKALPLLREPSPLRAQVHALWGQSLCAQRSFAQAEERYILAEKEAAPELKIELAYLRGEVSFELGKYEDARLSLEKIPLRHERAPEAIRLLARLGLVTNNVSAAGIWLSKGREEFPEHFLDSWVDYILLRAALVNNDFERMRLIRSEAEKRYPPSDSWLVLLNAEAEEAEWQSVTPLRTNARAHE